ncbi:unnamed protein product [Orchesella dallaii]|uniref:Major facilitator superfamily (MFS) profile domain-containing protein n=1 Tax=Orchesella dallaii TaxID=48710 RepID=A0ABP1QSH2_9HEXA
MKNGKYTVNSEDVEGSLACCGSTNNRMPQYLAAATVTIGGFSLGNVLGWSSPAIPNLTNSGDFPDIQNYQKAWIGSLVTIGALVGACCSGFLIEKIGRKKSLIVVGIPYITGWLTIALASQIYMLYIGRFLTGFSVGALSLVAPVYLCEISQSDIRGFLGAIFQVTVTVGILFTFVIGSMTSWQLLSATCGIFPLIFTIFSSLLPESPRYLIAKGRSEAALKALSWLRASDSTNPSKDVLEELDEIQGTIQHGKELQLKYLDLISLPILKPILITLGLMFFNQFCGSNAVGFYTVTIFEEADLGMDAHLSSIIVGVVQVVATALASAFVDKAGRRILLLLSFTIMCISLLALGTFFHLKNASYGQFLLESTHWIPLASVMAFNAAYCGGVGCLIWTVMSELLPNHVIGTQLCEILPNHT